MRIINVTRKIVVVDNENLNGKIYNFLSNQYKWKEIIRTNLKSKEKKIIPIGQNYEAHCSYLFKFEVYIDSIQFRPSFNNKSFIWIDLSDENLMYFENLHKGIFAISTPISMEYGQQLNDRMVQTPNYVYLDKEYGEFGTEKWLGFNIEWTFIVDFKVDIKSKIPKEVLLKAPAYKVEELDNGCVYVQLTEEEPLATEFDEEYVSGYIAFRKYCEDWIKENTK
jgi:hypothetical protein